jgi:hypothetical protein
MDLEDGDATEGESLPKASNKKKPPKPEESRSKKEHVNVVFIGHVGESSQKEHLEIFNSQLNSHF